MPKKTTTKKAAPAPKKGVSKPAAPKKNPLFERRPKNFGIGNDIQPKRDLSRFVRWPRYIRVQRQKKIILQRMKVPPTVNQFSKTVDKATAVQLFKLLTKYRPETEQAKKQRLQQIAAAKAQNQTVDIKKPVAVVHGLNAVVRAVEQKKAKLVVIAHDVDPIELVLWLPTLCRKLQVPYCIVKSRSRIGTLVYRKTCSAVAILDVNKEDKNELSTLATLFSESYNKNPEIRRMWGGGKLGPKALAAFTKRQRAVAKEQAAKAKSQ